LVGGLPRSALMPPDRRVDEFQLAGALFSKSL
jgi:hypothetical protein